MPRAMRAIAAATCRHSVSANAHTGEISVVGTLRRSCAECVGFVRQEGQEKRRAVKLAGACIFVSFCYGLATHSYRYHIGECPSFRTMFVGNSENIPDGRTQKRNGIKKKFDPLCVGVSAADDDFGRFVRARGEMTCAVHLSGALPRRGARFV